MYLLIRLIAGLCVAILLMVLFIIDERDRNKQQQTNTKQQSESREINRIK